MSNPLESLIYENIKSHFIYWLVRRNKFQMYKSLSQKYQHALNVWTDFFAFFGSGGDRLFHWGLIFGFQVIKVRPRFISLISAVFPPEAEAKLNKNVLLLQISNYKIMDHAKHAQQCWEATPWALATKHTWLRVYPSLQHPIGCTSCSWPNDKFRNFWIILHT
jgi:hypothetical protein